MAVVTVVVRGGTARGEQYFVSGPAPSAMNTEDAQ